MPTRLRPSKQFIIFTLILISVLIGYNIITGRHWLTQELQGRRNTCTVHLENLASLLDTVVTTDAAASRILTGWTAGLRSAMPAYHVSVRVSDGDSILFSNMSGDIPHFSVADTLHMRSAGGDSILVILQHDTEDIIHTTSSSFLTRNALVSILILILVWLSWMLVKNRRLARIREREIIRHLEIERELKESQAIFTAFMDQFPAPAFFKGSDFRVMYVNKYLRDWFDGDNAIGKTMQEIYPGSSGETMIETDRLAIENGVHIYDELMEDVEGQEHHYRTHKFSMATPDGDMLIGGLSIDFSYRARAEKLLRDNEEKYRLLANFNYDWEYWLKPDGSYAYISPACERVSGYSAEAFMEDAVLLEKICHDEDKPYLIHIPQGEPEEIREFPRIDFRIIHRLGQVKWLQHQCRRVYDSDGVWHGIRGSFKDITTEKEADLVRIENQEKFTRLFNSMDDAVFITRIVDNNHAYIVDVNIAAEQHTGYTRDELLNRNIMEMITDTVGPDDQKRNSRALRNGETVHVTEKKIRKDGSSYWTDVIISTMEIQDEKFGVSVNRDISHQLKFQERLNIMTQAVEQNPASIIITDSKGDIEFVNPRLVQSSGYSFDEVRGQNPRLFKSGEQSVSFYKDLWDTITSGRNWQGEMKNRRRDGSFYWEDVIIGPILDSRGEITHFMAIKLDITEQKFMQDQLQHSRQMESIGKLAGGVAHDFNNMLTAINGFADIGIMESEAEPMTHMLFTNIAESGRKAENIVRQLLAFSRKQIIQPKMVDVNAHLQNLHKMLRRLIGEDIRLGDEYAEKLPPIKVDPGQLDQTIINLVVNARDAVNEKTQIASEKQILIRTSLKTLDEKFTRKIHDLAPGRYVCISVEDNGIGISPDLQKNIFEPFFTTKGQGKGTGLGLATVYGITKQNQGHIHLESVPGQGSTFFLYFPAEGTQDVTPGQESMSLKNLPSGTERILIVEDDQSVLHFAKTILSNLHYTIYTASDGRQALDILETMDKKPDLMISDIVMPEMNGQELAEIVSRKYPEIHILFASGYTDTFVESNGTLNDSINFIPKPYNIRDLAFMLREILDGGKTQS